MSWVNEWTHVCWPTLALPKSPCCIISVGSHYISVWCRHYVSQHIHTHIYIYISSHPFKRRFFFPIQTSMRPRFSRRSRGDDLQARVRRRLTSRRLWVEMDGHFPSRKYPWKMVSRKNMEKPIFWGGGKKKTLKDSKNFNEFDLVPQSWLIISSSHPIIWAAWVKSLPRKRDVILTTCGHIEKSWIHILVGGFKHEFYFP